MLTVSLIANDSVSNMHTSNYMGQIHPWLCILKASGIISGINLTHCF